MIDSGGEVGELDKRKEIDMKYYTWATLGIGMVLLTTIIVVLFVLSNGIAWSLAGIGA